MRRTKSLVSVFLLLSVSFSAPVAAYIGPGSGISLLGGIWSVLVGIVLALAAILFWPIRLMIKRMRARKAGEQNGTAAQASSSTGDAD